MAILGGGAVSYGRGTPVHQVKAVELLGTMQGGYNVPTLIAALDDATLAPVHLAPCARNPKPEN